MSTANKKLSIDELKYIVMEGGGARGAVYNGAIKSLEELMKKRIDVTISTDLGERKSALLDFHTIENGQNVPAIKGIAGASAGAINSFVLALGFNSEEIDTILKYEFDNFLKDIDVGRYRMINENGELTIGEDKKNDFTNKKYLSEYKEFKFNFNDFATKIGDNNLKKSKRNLVSGIAFKILADGVASNLSFIERGITWIFSKINIDSTPPFLRGFLRWLLRRDNNMIARLGIAGTLNFLLFKVYIPLKFKLPFKVKDDTLMAVLNDRGMFSGFAVREFFMDLVIYASTRKTAFHRGFVELFENTELNELNKMFDNQVLISEEIRSGVGSKLLKYKDTFKIEEPERRRISKIGEDKELLPILDCLSRLTFDHLYKITKVTFGLSVANFTTGLPLYFGNEWTPDFRVMEAVGASMSIPPAIKPLYNASDVVKTSNSELPFYVKTDKGNRKFIKETGDFDVEDYYFFEHIVKMALAQEIGKEDGYIDTNNSLELNAFLPKLREIVVDKRFKVLDKDKNGDEIYRLPKENFEIRTTLNQPINGEIYTVDYVLYKFFYNATFKGLLLDGGYRNNIPYNFFRKNNSKLEGVLALKLDGTFPPALMKTVYENVKKYIDIEKRLDATNLDMENPVIKTLINTLDTERLKIRTQIEIIFGNELAEDVIKLAEEKDKEKRKELNKQVKQNNKVIDKLVDETINYYKKKLINKPWQQPKSVLSAAFEGYAYGSEMGQIKNISDHSYIIPLYNYGIDTYDFKMDKIRPLVKLAQAKAEEKVKEYFK